MSLETSEEPREGLKVEEEKASESAQEPSNGQHDDSLDSTSDSSEKFSPKSIVLAKVKGYPSWPAMILDESLLPENISSLKPKKIKQKKGSKPVSLLPVRFFSDDTYIWIKSSDLKPLSADTISKYFGNERRRKDKLLDNAYKLAQNPPDMELFIKWGSKGEPPKVVETDDNEPDLIDDDEDEELEELEEEDEEDYEEPPSKKRKRDSKKGSSGTSDKKGKSKSGGSKSKSSKSKGGSSEKSKPAPSKKETFRDQGYDSDWGLEEIKSYSYEDGNYIFDNEKDQKRFESEFPTPAELNEELATYHQQFDDLDADLTRHLLEEEIDEKQVLSEIKELRGVYLPKTVFMKSKVHKALIITVRRPEETFPYKSVKKEAAKLLKDWIDLTVPENTLEQMQSPKEETPQELSNGQSQQSPTSEKDVSQAPEENAVQETVNSESHNKENGVKAE
ncbi:Piso0_004878 [Millerozyma farinosa CBS 7064]|uniref:Piso0_004878 protein n=1 Tax=Pichia sorbitophila (strain ATCC MYA-4447 / BCRC 22081 / CBS 7064 / NBRC 10061 / NRRL Y-12695) TaxID=559304 RepID=G8Y3M4_PICSO|nr:Piso0_004878 [Millerozyma farinosa CBS 7064]